MIIEQFTNGALYMNKHYFVALAFVVLNIAPSYPGLAAINESAKDWQVKSLKGINTVKYGCCYDPDNKMNKIVTSGLSDIGVPVKSVKLKDGSEVPLSSQEALLKVMKNDREKGQCWVGLCVEQQSKLDRDPSITFDAETYKIGTLCPKSNVDSAIKELCARFVSDFNMSAK
jgi:hypothetical protein